MSKRNRSKDSPQVKVTRLPDGGASIIIQGAVAKEFIIANYYLEEQLRREVPPSEAFSLLLSNMLSIAETGKQSFELTKTYESAPNDGD